MWNSSFIIIFFVRNHLFNIKCRSLYTILITAYNATFCQYLRCKMYIVCEQFFFFRFRLQLIDLWSRNDHTYYSITILLKILCTYAPQHYNNSFYSTKETIQIFFLFLVKVKDILILLEWQPATLCINIT